MKWIDNEISSITFKSIILIKIDYGRNLEEFSIEARTQVSLNKYISLVLQYKIIKWQNSIGISRNINLL